VLSDGLLAQGSSPILLSPQDFLAQERGIPSGQESHLGPFDRNADGVRPWVAPGTPNKAHCNGGLEKDYYSGEISYEGENHEQMTQVRKAKVEGLSHPIAAPKYIPAVKKYLWIGYGSTSGGLEEYHYRNPSNESTYLILREIYPLPSNFWEICNQYQYVITVELADGQLARYLRGFAGNSNILSYSQMNASALELSRLQQWFNAQHKEEGGL